MNNINFELMKEFFEKSNKYDTKDIKRNSKMAGHIFAMIIKKYIEKIIEMNNLPYKVSLNNSFIEKIRTEWDLIIADKDGDEDEINIYDPKKVKCVIELKTASYFKGSEEKLENNNFDKNREIYIRDIDNRISKVEEIIKDNKFRYIYISLFQTTNYEVNETLRNRIKKMKCNKNKKSVFYFRETEGYKEAYDSVNDKVDYNELEEFLNNDFYTFIESILKVPN